MGREPRVRREPGGLDERGGSERGLADRLYQLGRGVRVLYLGWWILAERGGVELCGVWRCGAAHLPVVDSADIDDDRLLVRQLLRCLGWDGLLRLAGPRRSEQGWRGVAE